MAIDQRKQFTKQPNEKYPIDIDFGGIGVIPLGADHLVSAVASAVKWPRRQPTVITNATNEILLTPTPAIVGVSDTKARIMVVGGTHEFEYQITVRAVWDNGAELEEEIFVRVREE